MKPIFYIVAPEYRNSSCGVRVMHRLAHLINELDYKAYLLTDVINPEWKATFSPFYNEDNAIIIYPEVIHDNPYNAKHVSRYVLNVPGLLGGKETYANDEYVFYFGDKLKSGAQKASLRTLNDSDNLIINTVEDFFNDDAEFVKEHSAYYYGKGSFYKPTLPQLTDLTWNITPTFPDKREDLASLLKSCKYLFNYDNFSMLNEEALLCGCEVYIPNQEDLGWVKYISMYDLNKHKKNELSNLKKVITDMIKFHKIGEE